MNGKAMGTILTGAAVTMAAGAAYMAVKPSSAKQMKKFKKSTGKALKTVGSVINDINQIMN